MRFCLGLRCALLALGLSPLPTAGADEPKPPLDTISFRGASYTTVAVDPVQEEVHFYWADEHGKVLGNFTALQKQVAAEGARLLFAANAGMFDPASKPVGLLVQNGEEKFPLNLADGPGNFYLKPNGVFVINERHHALIVKSEDYTVLVPPALGATQSGPLLVYGDDINPDFMPDSKNRKIRSGVGVTTKGKVVFALSRQPVTFYEFAELFRTRLHCRDALYLDGEISAFWKPGEMEGAGQHHFGPIIAVMAPAPHEGVTATPAAP